MKQNKLHDFLILTLEYSMEKGRIEPRTVELRLLGEALSTVLRHIGNDLK